MGSRKVAGILAEAVPLIDAAFALLGQAQGLLDPGRINDLTPDQARQLMLRMSAIHTAQAALTVARDDPAPVPGR